MCRKSLLGAVLTLAVAFTSPTLAQEKGYWRAASTTARSITGDIAISNDKISVNYVSFPLAEIRTLTPDEVSAVFNPDGSAGGAANLYRVSIPDSRKFLHHNTLCGTEETDWVATYVVGHTLQVAMFSNPKIPTLTVDAIANGSSLCGTFTYVR